MPSIKINPTRGAIDLGSNSFRLLIAPVGGGELSPLVKELRTVRLAAGVHASGELDRAAILRGEEALRDFRQILDRYPPAQLIVRGTAALRQARNGQEFLHSAQEILGAPAVLLSGEQEALLALRGVLHGFPQQALDQLWVLDAGGGSTECIQPSQGEGPAVSLPLGAVSLSETFFGPGPPQTQELAQLALAVRARLNTALPPGFPPSAGNEPPPPPNLPTLIGTGGTATALATLDLELKKYDDTRVHGHILTKTRLERIVTTLASLPAAARNRLPGLDPGRGEILLAGGIIFRELLAHFAASQLRISDRGLLEGIWLSGGD